MKIFVKLFICVTIILNTYGSLFKRDTGWAGNYSEDYVQEKLMEVLQSDFSAACLNNQKKVENEVNFHIIKNESSFRTFIKRDLYDYKVGVEYFDYYTDEPIYTEFKVITALSPFNGKVIVHYVDEPHYNCPDY